MSAEPDPGVDWYSVIYPTYQDMVKSLLTVTGQRQLRTCPVTGLVAVQSFALTPAVEDSHVR